MYIWGHLGLRKWARWGTTNNTNGLLILFLSPLWEKKVLFVRQTFHYLFIHTFFISEKHKKH